MPHALKRTLTNRSIVQAASSCVVVSLRVWVDAASSVVVVSSEQDLYQTRHCPCRWFTCFGVSDRLPEVHDIVWAFFYKQICKYASQHATHELDEVPVCAKKTPLAQNVLSSLPRTPIINVALGLRWGGAQTR